MSEDSDNPAAAQARDAMYAPEGTVHALASTVPELPAAKDIEIDPDKVLQVAGVIEKQANALQHLLNQRLGQLHLDPPAGDVVSKYAIEAWNELVADGESSYATRVRNYVDGLRTLADQIREASHTYRDDDEGKAAAFKDRRVYQA
ncbi:hypothetical protein [Amycolatopsis anabasis]|uniref:hypothetical protein n=1 Tax=Amycolatopsis anabasis TaxID=1840409 RepID=UPI001FE4AB20|nr:hypothetical protein [Amycolatopsis anabasis]